MRKVKAGEATEGDVRRALGTGDVRAEQEWEDVVREVKGTDVLWEGRKRREEKRAQKAEQAEAREGPGRQKKSGAGDGDGEGEGEGEGEGGEGRRPKFLM